jgi:hypothetical protein
MNRAARAGLHERHAVQQRQCARGWLGGVIAPRQQHDGLRLRNAQEIRGKRAFGTAGRNL